MWGPIFLKPKLPFKHYYQKFYLHAIRCSGVLCYALECYAMLLWSVHSFIHSPSINWVARATTTQDTTTTRKYPRCDGFIIILVSVIYRIMAFPLHLQHIHVTLCEKVFFSGMFKLRILRWRDYPGLSRWAQVVMCIYKREEDQSHREM